MWQIHSDNRITTSGRELKSLKTPRRIIPDKILFIECPQFPVMDSKTAHFIAAGRLSDAVIGECGKIVVRGKVWHYEYKTLDLNREARRKWGNRTGFVQNPLETVMSGCFYDTTRALWSVPTNFNPPRSTTKFPAARH